MTPNPDQLLGVLAPFKNEAKLIVDEQTTADIIKMIQQAHTLHARDYDKIAASFWAGNVEATCKKIFNFLKRNVKYDIEPEDRQSVKSPAAILVTGGKFNGKNDCKHYSLFIAGILDALNRAGKKIPWAYRFANYRLFQDSPHHVFVVANPGKNEIWIDPVLQSFNQRKPYINAIDKKMALYSINGIGCNNRPCNCGHRAPRRKIPVTQLSGSFGTPSLTDLPTIAGKAKRRARKAKRKERRTRLYCKGALAKKIALAPARNAFLALVRLNVKKMALRLEENLKDPQRKKKLSAKWCKLGGTFKKLETAIVKAATKYRRRRKISGMDDGEIIGVPIAAALAAAAPIIKALKEFLSKLKKGGEDGGDFESDGAEMEEMTETSFEE